MEEENKTVELKIKIPEDLYKYLVFLEKQCFIESIDKAVISAFEVYKMFSMHEWLPYIYRMGGRRVVLMDTGAVKDLLQVFGSQRMRVIARLTAIKRKMMDPMFDGVDFSKTDNWGIVLKELETLGWGKFTQVKNEVKIEFCALPLPYVMGYLEGMFNVRFKVHYTKIPETVVLIGYRRKSSKT